jgi:hypothetical protein
MILLVRAEIDAEIAQRKNLLKKTNKAKSRDTEN